MITLYAKQKKRHRYTEQTFGLCGRRRGWDVQREQHWNKYTIKGETDCQSRLDAWDKCSGLVHWEDPEGWDGEGGGREGSGWGTHVNPWLIHVNVWQKPLQYCKVISLQLIKTNGKKKNSQYTEYWCYQCQNKTLPSSPSTYIIIALFNKFTCKQRKRQYTYKATETEMSDPSEKDTWIWYLGITITGTKRTKVLNG